MSDKVAIALIIFVSICYCTSKAADVVKKVIEETKKVPSVSTEIKLAKDSVELLGTLNAKDEPKSQDKLPEE